ncbi:hypothetical protein LMG27177_01438 [Paraburkholderia fynbosensis]|uniref:Uncharacterized protein n=1 Tax=Paraburkholderia fynbosensis TaxID=1200993 RepID=A0A6J5FM44_9BURK|nr:hypothetical protein [Paraburkholderia fynbosensis]CAB3783166.1 hypothetical protein LMG27177_01438 [Paraburkholderia fynbosensis]
MEFKTYTVLTLMVVSNAALAWQPLTYPIQSQSPYQRSIDTALCFAQANKTKIDIKREPQIPPRPQPATKATSTGVPSRPPLPPSTFSATPTSASMPAAATAPGASEPVTTAATGAGASVSRPASAPAAGVPNTATTAATPASTATTATTADMGASGAAAGSSEQANAASSVKLPPLPAPEPPMTQYWAAYGACMQARGYVVAQ